MKIKKKNLIILLIIILTPLIITQFIRTAKIEHKGPNRNVILITFDALRADHLGIYGYEKNISPNIDSFAKKSYVFKNSLSQCGTTLCSLPSIHTSKFSYVDNLLEEGITLKSDELTLAEILKEHNYSTLAVVANTWAKSKYGISRGFDIFNEDFKGHDSGYETRLRVIKILDNKKKEPFFLWVHFRPPHSPYNPSKETFEELYPNPNNEPTKYGNTYDQVIDYYSKTKNESIEEYSVFSKKRNLTSSMVNQFRAAYDGAIKEVDKEFGKLIDYIDNSGLSDNTMIIISSDHGESLGEHNIIDHNDLYYGILHTPLIFHLPSNEHKIIEYPVMNVDIFPTILKILDIKSEKDIRGEDLFNENRTNNFQFAEYTNKKTIKKGDYKLIFYPEDSSKNMLFNIAEDPDEKINLINSHRDLALELMQLWKNISKSKNNISQEDMDTLERLKDLGYML